MYLALDRGVQAFKEGMGESWKDTVVIALTEFGRTVKINGTRGTDHGTGGAAFLFGGTVKGGRVIADWPGLKESQLNDGRDLKATTDNPALLMAVMRDHLGVSEGAFGRILPGSEGIKPLPVYCGPERPLGDAGPCKSGRGAGGRADAGIVI